MYAQLVETIWVDIILEGLEPYSYIIIEGELDNSHTLYASNGLIRPHIVFNVLHDPKRLHSINFGTNLLILAVLPLSCISLHLEIIVCFSLPIWDTRVYIKFGVIASFEIVYRLGFWSSPMGCLTPCLGGASSYISFSRVKVCGFYVHDIRTYL